MSNEIIDTDITKGEVQLVRDLHGCLCAPMSISNIRRTHLKLLQFHHHDVTAYPEQFEHLQCLKHDPDDPSNSTLTVASDSVFDPSKTDQFPGVFVGVEGLAMKKEFMGNDAGYTFDNSGEHVAKLSTFQLGIKNVSASETQVVDLAELNLQMMLAQSANLRDKLGLIAHDVLGFDKPKKIKDSPDVYFQSTLLINIQLSYGVTAFTESHRMKKIVTELGAELSR